MRSRITHPTKQCAAHWGEARCERPAHDGGPHRAEIYDDNGQPTGRVQSWFDRWTLNGPPRADEAAR